MNKITKILAMLLLVCTVVTTCVSCDVLDDILGQLNPGIDDTEDPDTGNNGKVDPTPDTHVHVDYASNLKLDMTSSTKKQEVTVKIYVDGDTTHFYVPTSVSETGVLKARYLGINTPESTGKIEEWGKTASNYTKSKLQSAVSIIVESDDGNWNIDSTGSRYLVWIWYKTSEDADYRNLNIELLQEGLAIASNSANNRYGETCIAAINQAKIEKLKIYSGEQDPNFYYGTAKEITLKELRTNIKAYEGQKVAFEGVVIKDYNQGVYVEEYDEETGICYGIYIYYGNGANGYILDILSVGNRVRVVGSVQYYEAGDSYQVSGVKYRAIKPNDPENTQKIGDEKHDPAYTEIKADDFVNGKITVTRTVEDEETGEEKNEDVTLKYAEAVLATSVSMKNLVVTKVYTTTNDESSQNGAMTLTCTVDGVTVSIRTAVLYDANKQLVTADYFKGKTIDVRGIVDSYKGAYQIRVISLNDINVH